MSLLESLLQLILLLLHPIILIPTITIIVVFVLKNKKYKSSAYYKITKLPYWFMRLNLGRYGEYLIYKYLRKFETNGSRFLFNVYLPKGNEETTEIDVLMISPKGIFVFESKNYSGWIFGDENQKNWCQTLPKGRGRSHKEQFYNPIMQNRSHIKYLKQFLGDRIPVRSIITFSERCTLKNVQVHSNDVCVIKRNRVLGVVSNICTHTPNILLNDSEIIEIYNKLYPYTQVNAEVREKHIANIHTRLSNQPVRKNQETFVPYVTDNITEIVTEQNEPVADDTSATGISDEILVTKSVEPITNNSVELDVLKCPRCNGELVLRTATRGANAGKQFYGCSNYPKCKYIQNI